MNNEESNVIDFAEAVAAGKIKEVEAPDEREMFEWTFSNDKSNNAIRQLFHMFYQIVFDNKLGLMHALNTESDKVETLIVGVEQTPNGTACWPIAKILTEEEQGKYKSPDGNGGWV